MEKKETKEERRQREIEIQSLGLRVAQVVQGYRSNYVQEILDYAEKIAVGEYAYKSK
jgi:hypothetical protein